MTEIRLLVTGSRHEADVAPFIESAMRAFSEWYGTPSVVIHGAASGADTLAARCAGDLGIPLIAEPADWRAHGKAAGPIRNQRMIDAHRPTHCLAFPGGRGTADMKRRAKSAGILVVEATQIVTPSFLEGV